MKIHTILRRINQTNYRSIAVFGLVVMLATTMSTSADAQTGGLLKYLSSGPSTGLNTHTASSRPTQISNNGKNYRVVSQSNVRTAADTEYRGRIGSAVMNASNPSDAIKSYVEQTGFHGGCHSCNKKGCGGRCGGGGGHGLGGHGGFGGGCGTCNPYQYVSVDYLYIERDGEERFSLSPNFGLGGFDFESGVRVTAGSVPDCVHGMEVSFTGPIDWDISSSLSDPTGNIQTFLVPGNPIPAANLSAFNNSTFQSQTYTADYWSIEASKTLVGWDIAKLLFGTRYVDYDEEYAYFAQNGTDTGLLRSDVNNQLFGAQVGLDLLYPIACHAYTDFRGRAGAYLNFVEDDVSLSNAGANVFANGDDDTEIAGLFEVGTGIRYQLGEALSVRVGTELWYLAGVATAPDQINQVVTPDTGTSVRADDDVLFYGFNLSAQLRW